MQKYKTAKNYLYNLSYQLLIIIVPLITTPYISRVLHPNGVGVFSYTYSIASIFALFATLGTNVYGQRQIAYVQSDIQKRSSVFWEIFFVRIFIGGIVTIIYFIFSLNYSDYSTLLLMSSFIVLSVPFDISWYFMGVEQFKVVVIRNVLVKLSSVLFVFIFVKTSDDVWKYIIINSLSSLVSNLFLFINLRGEIIRFDIRNIHYKKHVVRIIEFFIPVMAVQVYSQIDKVMLGGISNNLVENGYYEQARKISSFGIAIIVSLNQVMSSRISSLYADDRSKEILEYFRKTIKYIWMMAFPIVVGLYSISDNFTYWFFGKDFAGVSLLLKLFAPVILFAVIGNFVGMQYLIPTNNQNKGTVAYLCAAVINVFLNFALIPKYLSIGAVIATIVAEFVSCSLQVLFLKRSKFNFRLSEGIWKYISSAIVMGIIISAEERIIATGAVKTFIEIGSGFLFYIGFLALLKEENIMVIFEKMNMKLSVDRRRKS